MIEQFKLRIAHRRQITVPIKLLEILNLQEGDLLEINVVNGHSFTGRGLKLVPANLFTPEIVEKLRQRESEMSSTESFEATSVEELVSRVRRPRAKTAEAHNYE